MSGEFECIVGGISYRTNVAILSSVPESFFQIALSVPWNSTGANVFRVDRDGTHFQHILDYLRFGYLPRDSAGRCVIPKDTLELLLVEADFYCLPALTKEIEQLLTFNLQGMRYFVSKFYLNSGRGGGLYLKEFSTYEAAAEMYAEYKQSAVQAGYVDNVLYGDEEGDSEAQNIVVRETVDAVTGMVDKECFEDGSWKRPSGLQLLCVPIGANTTDDVLGFSSAPVVPPRRDLKKATVFNTADSTQLINTQHISQKDLCHSELRAKIISSFLHFQKRENVMSAFELVKKSCPSKLVNAWKVRIGSRPFLITPAHVCVYGANGRWAMSSFLKELSSYDWKISASYVSKPSPFHDLAWTELDGGKEDEECIVLGSGIQRPTKVDVFFRQPLSHDGKWVAEHSEMGQTEALLYPSPPQVPELSEGELDEPGGFRGMSGALALRHGVDSESATCEGMLIKGGSLRPFFKKVSSSHPPVVASASEEEERDFLQLPRAAGKYTWIQRAVRGFLGIDTIFGAMERKLDYLVKNGLVKSDLHEIGVVIDARRGIFLPANMMTEIVTNSAAVPVHTILGKKAPLLAKS
eukprot:gene29124-35152_t